MTIEALITSVLEKIKGQFYQGRGREYLRDQRALMMSIARYGYQCNQRGWDFEEPFIRKELVDLLNDIQRRGADIRYLPRYLEGAVDRHLGQRAEELSAMAKTVQPRINRLVNTVKTVEAIREQSGTELMAKLYLELKKVNRHRKAIKKAPAVKERQESLL